MHPCAGGRENAPVVVGANLGGSFPTHTGGEESQIVVVQVYAAQEGYQLSAVLEADDLTTAVLEVQGSAQVICSGVCQEITALHGGQLINEVLVGITGDGRYAHLIEFPVIRQGIFVQLVVGFNVSLKAVTIALKSAYVQEIPIEEGAFGKIGFGKDAGGLLSVSH